MRLFLIIIIGIMVLSLWIVIYSMLRIGSDADERMEKYWEAKEKDAKEN